MSETPITGKVLVLYHSGTGHTAQMAKHVAEGVERYDGALMELRVRTVEEATAEDIFWCDGIACGTPTHLGGYSFEMKRFWDQNSDKIWSKTDGKIACAFSSSGGYGGGTETACLSMLIVLMNFGFLTFGVTDYVATKFTAHYGAITARAPRDEQEKDSCRRLGHRLCEWIAVYVLGRKDLHPLLTTKANEHQAEEAKQKKRAARKENFEKSRKEQHQEDSS